MKDSAQSLVISVAWIGGTQVVTRLARIVSTIAVARVIAPELLGVAAIVLATNEMAHVFAKNATNSRIIRATEDDVQSLSDTAYFVNWIAGLTIFILQCLVGLVLSVLYEDSLFFYLISVLALSYLMLPLAQVQSALNLRQEKIGLISRIEIQQTVVDSILTVSMVLLGLGVWALVLPKLFVIPLWIRAHRKACQWKRPKKVTLARLSDHMTFNSRVLGVELMGVFRHNIDYILIGYFLGMHTLGIYYFAFNAGLGLSRGFIISLNNAFYPYLCAVRKNVSELDSRFRRGMAYMLVLMVPLLAIQAYFADVYVPLLFGEQWAELGATQYVSLLCLAGVPLMVTEAGAQYMRAQGRPSADLRWHCVYSLLFFVAVFVGLQWGLMGVVLAVLFAQFTAAPIHYLCVANPKRSLRNQVAHVNSGGFLS